jgi:uncharacterized membrane protein YkvA (DUF1232 family)
MNDAEFVGHALPDKRHQRHYSDDGFWRKVRKYARIAGRGVIERALRLYYAAESPDTPAWARTVIFSALGYFILPADLIPDLVPAAGYTDDLGVLAGAIVTVAAHITPRIRHHARQTCDAWFGPAVRFRLRRPGLLGARGAGA